MATDDFLRARLDQVIDLRHPRAMLARRLRWGAILTAVAPKFAHQARPAKRVRGEDLPGSHKLKLGGGVSNAGRPHLPVRLMASLVYLKHSSNLSNEEIVERLAVNVQRQFFRLRLNSRRRLADQPRQIACVSRPQQ